MRKRFFRCNYSRLRLDSSIKGMRYLRKVASSCEQFGPVSTYLWLKYMKFSFQNFGNSREDKNTR